MFEELHMRVMHDEDHGVYVSVIDLAYRLYLATQGIYSESAAKVDSGEMSMEQTIYMQGILDGFGEVGKLLSEGGLADQFSQELDEMDNA